MQVFNVEGMGCGGCETAVTRAVQSVDPGAAVTIDRPAGKVTVGSDAPAEAIRAAIEDEGYTVHAQ